MENEGQPGDGAAATGVLDADNGGEPSADADGASSEGQSGEGGESGGQAKNKKWVPLERFQEVIRSNQQFKQQLAQLQEIQEQIQGSGNAAERMDELKRQKDDQRKFWTDPFGYVQESRNRDRTELREQVTRIQNEARDFSEYRSMMTALQNAPGFSNELETSMASFLRENGLSNKNAIEALGRANVLRIAYTGATGKKWGDWQKDAYTTRLAKERLMRPASGAGARPTKMLSPEEFDKLPLEAYEKDVQGYNAALESWHIANSL